MPPGFNNLPADDARERDTSRDPYALWRGRPLESLPYNEVRDGIAIYLVTFYEPIWDALTPHRHPFYLKRKDGLHAWSRYEADCRLSNQYREFYSITEFHELIFNEDMHRSGSKTLTDPFWSPLFVYKQREGDIDFFRRLPWLVKQPERPMHNGMRRLCIGWDRELIPLSYWTYPAIARRITCEEGRKVATENTLRQWAFLLELKQEKPAVVTGCSIAGDPVIDGAALDYHKIPDPP
jgi:hypothetical protein